MAIDTNSKSLREFSLTIVKGDTKYVIQYGYDLCIRGGGVYVRASVNGSPFSASKKTLTRVKRLNIEAINRLISLIGCDHAGVPEGYPTTGIELIRTNLYNASAANTVLQYYRCAESNDIDRLAVLIQKMIANTASSKVIKRYHNSNLLRYLNDIRETVRMLRDIQLSGVTIDGRMFTPQFTGYLKSNPYPTYYKRDIDYIRKSRVRIYTQILKRYYVPFE